MSLDVQGWACQAGDRVGVWPAFGPAADAAVALVQWHLRSPVPGLRHLEKGLKECLNILLYCDMPVAADLVKRGARPGANRGWRDPRWIAHTRGYLDAWVANGGRGTEVEHVVPWKVLVGMFRAAGPDRPEALRWVLSRYFLCARLTKAEHGLLAKRGLQHKMPTGWAPGDEPWARWDAAGLGHLPPQEVWTTDIPDHRLKEISSYRLV